MSLMPGHLLKHVMRVLDEVAHDPREPKQRRSIAAYELALSMVAYSIDESSEDGDGDQILRMLNLLRIAIENDHQECKWIIGWMHETFNQHYPNEKSGWLVEGMTAGSRIAARRLQKLFPDEYRKTRQVIQQEYQGIGLGWRVRPEYIQENPEYYPGAPVPKSHQLVLAASCGSLPQIQTLIAEDVDIDSVDGMLETPLVAACRSGHVHVVEFLLENGADASKLSKENISPLHFLSSFDDDAIPSVALQLLAAGCPVEAHSTGHSSLNNGHTGSDRFYGLVDGTPLLWAVAADNFTAVKTLLNFGADPFDLAGTTKSLPYSPIGYASALHQFEILEELLSAFSKDQLSTVLNPTPRAEFTGSFRGPPLGPAVAYSGGLIFYRMQLHGRQHREQCRKTIEFLLSAGANPSQVDSSGQTALHYAGIHGQPYALHALLEWQGGVIRPDTALWVEILIGAVHNDCRSTFKVLLDIDFKPNEEYSWPMIIGTVAEQQGSLYYVDALISHHQKLCSGSADYTIPFELALQKGCFDCAKVIFSRAEKCDIVHRRFHTERHNGHVVESMTLLGRLMRHALIFASELSAVREFLEITGGPEHLFEDAWDLAEGKYNALQVAVQYAPHGKTKTVTTGLLEIILRYFKDPVRHLGTIYASKNLSLLHLAVRHGNAAAVEMLLNYDGIDFGQRDNESLTAFDRALNRLQDSWRDKELQFWEVPDDQLSKAREKWDHDSRVMIFAMQAKGASKYSTYSHVFKKIEENTIRRWIIYPDDGRIEVTDFGVTTFARGELLDRVATLPVGRCSYLAMFADPEVISKIPGGRPLEISDMMRGMQLES